LKPVYLSLTAYSDQEVTSAEQTQLYGHGLFA